MKKDWVTLNGEHILMGGVGTAEEAAQFSKDSAIKETLYHGVGDEGLKQIQSKGFKTDPEGTFGNAVYFTTEKDKANDYGQNIVEAKVNVATVKTISSFQDLTNQANSEGVDLANLIDHYSRNYDAMRVTNEGYVAVFNPRNTMAIVDKGNKSLGKTTPFDPDSDYITDGVYVWQGDHRYPVSVLDDDIKTWFDPDNIVDEHLRDFVNYMTKAGIGMAEIAFASLLLMSTSDYLPFAKMGQDDAVSHIQTRMPGTKVITSTQDTIVFDLRTSFLASQMSKTMKDTVDNILQNGIANNATYQMMHDQILQSFGLNPANMTALGWRAERIARTESMWAVREGALQEYEAQGITYVNLSIMDTACDVCIGIAQDNPYLLEDAGNIGDGDLHPNCRCIWLPDEESFIQSYDKPKEDFFIKQSEPDHWVTINGNKVPMDADNNPLTDKGRELTGGNPAGRTTAQQTEYVHMMEAMKHQAIVQIEFERDKNGNKDIPSNISQMIHGINVNSTSRPAEAAINILASLPKNVAVVPAVMISVARWGLQFKTTWNMKMGMGKNIEDLTFENILIDILTKSGIDYSP